jgi:hypothetical protein
LTVREVDDSHDSKDQRKPEAHQGVNAAQEDAIDDNLTNHREPLEELEKDPFFPP